MTRRAPVIANPSRVATYTLPMAENATRFASGDHRHSPSPAVCRVICCPRAESICAEVDPPLVPSPTTPAQVAACHFAFDTAPPPA